jgi:hypothetical protein
MPKSFARERASTGEIARKPTRSLGATNRKAIALGVMPGGGRKQEKGIRALRAIRWRVRLTFDCGTLVPMTKNVMSQQTFCEFIVSRLAGVTI